MYEINGAGSPICDLDLKKTEKKLNVSLPPEYRIFLKQNNGGRPNPKFFPLHGFSGSPVGQVLDFFGINDPYKSCCIDWNYLTLKSRMPNGFFPIACEDGGNIICLVTSGDKYGHVYYWDHNEETIPPTMANVYLIAESFQAFLDSLHDFDISTI